jgi:hypothetical protein
MYLLYALLALLLGSGSCLAQVSTMGTTAMGLPTTPGAIVSSPLNGPSPFSSFFSAATLQNTPVTTLAPVPLAQDPTIAGTSVNCSPSAAQAISPSVLGVTPSIAAFASTTTAGSAMAALSPSMMTTASTPTMPNTAVTSTTSSSILPPTVPAVVLGSLNASATGTVPAPAPLGSSTQAGSCTSAPAIALTDASALPLSTPDIPANPPPGALQSPVTELDSTSISQGMAIMPTPNSAACSDSSSMDVASPAMMAPANATGATATPGVPPAGC